MDIKNHVGGLVISEEVISKIATTAALEIDGVVDICLLYTSVSILSRSLYR